MKWQNLVFFIGVFIFGMGLFRMAFRERRIVETQELSDQLNTSTPSLNSTVSLRTALMKILSEERPQNNFVGHVGVPKVSENLSAIRDSVKKDNQALAQRKFTHREVEMGTKYFEKLTESKPTKRLFEKSKEIFGHSSEGLGAAQWVTLGVRLESSPQFAAAFEMATQKAINNPNLIMEKIDSSIAEIRADPFIYQMTFNLVFRLGLDPAKLAQFFGQEFEQQLRTVTDRPTDAFWVSKMGLMLARQAGLTGDELAPYFARGFAAYKGSPQVLLDYRKTAQFYFPEAKL